MILRRKLFGIPGNVKFLGKEIEFPFGSSNFNGFNIKKLENRAKIDDFYNAVLDYESKEGESLYPHINKSNIKSRLDISVDWDNYDKKLNVTLLDKKSDFFWSFMFFSPEDKIEVAFAGD